MTQPVPPHDAAVVPPAPLPPAAIVPDPPGAASPTAVGAAAVVRSVPPDGPPAADDLPAPDAPPATDRRIAHVLLASGNLVTARVQLEMLAGRGALDVPGLLDLAESRWRMGDLAGAGEAATGYRDHGGVGVLGTVIAAEAAVAAGNRSGARALAGHALEQITRPLDAIFAGQEHSSIWPHDPAEAVPPAATPPPARLQPPQPPPVPPSDDGAAFPSLAPAASLDAARQAIEAGDLHGGAVRLAVVLRLSPALAPAVLDLVGQLPGPEFDLVRGDSLRLVGHEAAAGRAFAAAAESLRQSPQPRSAP